MADDIENHPESKMWTHVLGEFSCLEDLSQPIKISARIKYTSLAVSAKYLAVGASSGAIYIFQKEEWRYLQMLPGDNEGSVLHVSFSPDENILAYATSEGLVMVISLKIANHLKPDKLRSSRDHKGCTVTALHWNEKGDRLYVGDDAGRVTLIKVPTTKVQQVFSSSTETIMRLDSPLVQIDVCEEKILVSTLKRSYLGNTSKQQFSPIGTKGRDGLYGACFYHGPGIEKPVVYCARPGSRMWEVDYEGTVLNTHQFKKLLDIPPLPVINLMDESAGCPRQLGPSPGPQSVSFQKLLLCGDKYILTWTTKSVYLFNPAEAKVLLWSTEFTGISDIQVHHSDLYLMFSNNSVRKLSLLPVTKIVQRLVVKQKWVGAANVCLCFKEAITRGQSRKHVPQSMLNDLRDHLVEFDQLDLAGDLDNVMNDLEMTPSSSNCSSRSSRTSSITSFERLDSGIYVIRRRTESETLAEPQNKKESQENNVKIENVSEIIQINESPASDGTITPVTDIQNGTDMSASKPLEIDSVKSIPSVVINNGSPNEEMTDTQNLVLPEDAECDGVSLQRVPSTESLQSITSMSSNEIMFGEQEPVYSKTGNQIRQRGKKLKSAKIISLDPEAEQGKGSPKFKRSQSTTVLEKKRQKPPLKTSTSMSALTEQKEGEPGSSAPPAGFSGSPVAPSSGISGSSVAPSRDLSPSDSGTVTMSDAASLMSSTEMDGDERFSSSQGSTGETSANSGEEASPKLSFFAVKDKISSKVSLTAKSLVKTLKDQKNKLSKKEGMLVDEPKVHDCDIPPTAEVKNEETAEDISEGDKTATPKPKVFPKIDLTKLRLKTQEARSKIAEPTVIYNPKHARVVLTEWVEELHESLRTLHSKQIEEEKSYSEQEVDTMKPTNVRENGNDDCISKMTSSDEVSDISSDNLFTSTLEGSTEKSKNAEEIFSDQDGSNRSADIPEELLVSADENIVNTNVVIRDTNSEARLIQDSNRNICLTDAQLDASLQKLDLTDGVEILEGNCNSNNSTQLKKDLEVSEECTLPVKSSQLLTNSEKTLSENTLGNKMECSSKMPKMMNLKDFVYLTDPFGLESDLFAQISELALKCFDFNCHGFVSRYIDPRSFVPSRDLQESFRTSSDVSTNENICNPFSQSESCLQKDTGILSGSLCYKHCDWTCTATVSVTCPSSGTNFNSDDKYFITGTCYHGRISSNLSQLNRDTISPDDDYELGLLLQYYFYLFSNDLGRVRKAIAKFQGSRCERWQQLITCQQEFGKDDLVSQKLKEEDIEGAFDLLRSGLPQERKAMLAHLNSLYLLTPLKTLQFSCENHRQVSPLEVLYMCQKLSRSFKKHLCYYAKHFLTASESGTRQRELCSDPEVYLYVLDSLFKMATEDMKSSIRHCNCGAPWPGSHLIEWPDQQLLDSLLNFTKRKTCAILNIIRKYGYWKGFLQEQEHLSSHQRAAIVLQLGDISLLSSDSQIGYHPENEDDWSALLSLKQKQYGGNGAETKHRHFCLICGDSLHTTRNKLFPECDEDTETKNSLPFMAWESLGRLMLEGIGVKRAIKILQQSQVPDGELSIEFYQDCAAAAILETKQRQMVHGLLEKVDTYLWSARPAAVQPQLAAALDVEKNEKDTVSLSSLDKHVSRLAGATSIPRTLEDQESHWGVDTKLVACCVVCGLNLADLISAYEPGTIYFQCGHGYHRACLPEKVCLQCISY